MIKYSKYLVNMINKHCLPRVTIFVSGLLFLVVACASASNAPPAFPNCKDNVRYESQGFSFDAKLESPDVEIVDYFYGTEDCPSQKPDLQRERGVFPQTQYIVGPMRRYEKLYVRWRNKGSGQEYEDTVDLRQHLPSDMTRQRIHFTIRGAQLCVFLVTPEYKAKGEAPDDGPKVYQARRIVTLHPEKN